MSFYCLITADGNTVNKLDYTCYVSQVKTMFRGKKIVILLHFYYIQSFIITTNYLSTFSSES